MTRDFARSAPTGPVPGGGCLTPTTRDSAAVPPTGPVPAEKCLTTTAAPAAKHLPPGPVPVERMIERCAAVRRLNPYSLHRHRAGGAAMWALGDPE